MYAIIGEDWSDVKSISCLLRRISRNSAIPIQYKGYDGCGEMLQKGARQLNAYSRDGCSRFIVCYDADSEDPVARRERIRQRIITQCEIEPQSCLALVPVQELEAWILADITNAVSEIIPSWRPSEIPHPEAIQDPKEHLERLSKATSNKPRYSPAIHNEKAAKKIDLEVVFKKCPSFRPLLNFVSCSAFESLPKATERSGGDLELFSYDGMKANSHGILCTCSEWSKLSSVLKRLPNCHGLRQMYHFAQTNVELLRVDLNTVLTSSERQSKGLARRFLELIDGIDGVAILLDDGTR